MNHLLYFTGYRMVVFRWKNDEFNGFAEFDPIEQDFYAFEKLLTREVKSPVKLLIDIIEEDFRIEKVPHLYGKDAKDVQTRTLNKYFRQYSHTNLIVQGRDSSGRKDDTVLISALSNSDLFQPWLDILNKLKIPLRGIFTVPLVGQALLKPLNKLKGNALVISQQVPSNVRQSFYLDGHLKLSRLAPSRDDSTSHFQMLSEETERTIRFLENQHYLKQDEKLDVYVIVPGSQHQELSESLKSDWQKQYHIIDKDVLGMHLGIKSKTPGEYSDWLYAHILLSNKYAKPHYGTVKDKKYFFHYLANKSMLAASVAFLAISVFFSGFTLIDTYLHSRKVPQLKEDTTRYKQLYDKIISEISSLSIDVKDVKDAVSIADKIQKRQFMSPLPLMTIVSKQVMNSSDIKIDNVEWLITSDEGHSFGESKQDAGLSARLKRLKKSKKIEYEKALVEGSVIYFNNNPRIAVEKVNNFIDGFKKVNKFSTVEAIKMPFDIDPDSRLTGEGLKTGNKNSQPGAKFSFVLIKEKPL